MSERCSFTSEYIYNNGDYKKVREAFEKQGNGSFFCTAEPCIYGSKKDIREINLKTNECKKIETKDISRVEVPIVQGRVRGLGKWDCIEIIKEILDELELESEIRFIIVFEYNEICVIDKDCGNTTCNYKCIEIERMKD